MCVSDLLALHDYITDESKSSFLSCAKGARVYDTSKEASAKNTLELI